MDFDPEGKRLPIKIDSATNAEYCPLPLSPTEQAANRHAHEFIDQTTKAINKNLRALLQKIAFSGVSL